MLKEIFYISILCFFIAGCGSVPRFTNSNDAGETKEISTKKTSEEEKIYDEKNEQNDEYADVTPLETVIGVASYYASKFNGRETANGEIYDMHQLTAAHPDYPFDTIIRVTNLLNNQSVIVRINDRKPNTNGRIIDLSLKAAQDLKMVITGITKVKLEVLKWGNG